MMKCREANIYNSFHKMPVKGKGDKVILRGEGIVEKLY